VVEFVWENFDDDPEMLFEISTNGGVNWEPTLATLGAGTFATQNIVLPNYTDNKSGFRIRFVETFGPGGANYGLIDNVVVRGETVGGIGTVRIDGVLVTNVVSWSDTSIDVIMPAGVTNGVIRLTNACGSGFVTTSNVVVPAPGFVNISGFSPRTNCVGNNIIISGAGFGNTRGTGKILVDGVVPVVNSWNATSIDITIPAGVTNGPIRITNSCGAWAVTTSNVVVPYPVVTNFVPSSACIGSSVIINGSGFESVRGAGKVVFNGTPVVTYNSWSDTSIDVVLPAGTTTGTLAITNNCLSGFITISNFTVLTSSVTISKTASIVNGSPGDTNIYKIVVSNSSACTASGVLITDLIPSGATYIAGSMKKGSSSDTYASAPTTLDDALDSGDEGSFGAGTVSFAFNGGDAPGTAGALAVGTSVAGFFKVKIASNTPGTPSTNTVGATNTTASFDGFIISNAVMSNSGYIGVGDWAITNAGGPGPITNITLFSDSFEANNMGAVWDTVANATAENSAGPPLRGSWSGRINRTGGSRIEEAIDLSGYSNAVIEFVWENFDDDPKLEFSISTNNGGLWEPELAFLNNGLFATQNIVLPNYTDNKSGFRIRFGQSFGGGGLNFGLVDNVVVRAETAVAGPATYTNKQVNGFTAFNLRNVPLNGNITAATLILNVESIRGQGGDVGPIILDHVDYTNTFEAGDYDNVRVISSAFDTFPASTGVKNIDVTAEVQSAFLSPKSWAKDGTSRWFGVRMRPTGITPDDETDLVYVGSSDVGTEAFVRIWYTTNIGGGPPPTAITNTAKVNGINFTLATNTNIINILALPDMVIDKIISSIQLAGAGAQAYPGATITYQILYTNKGSGPAQDLSIFDSINANYLWSAGSAISPANFTNQWATNASPDQTFTSTDYSNTEPLPADVTWVRFKAGTVAAGETGVLEYQVIVR